MKTMLLKTSMSIHTFWSCSAMRSLTLMIILNIRYNDSVALDLKATLSAGKLVQICITDMQTV